MAKRFIDTDIFKKSFTRSLQGAYKTLWVYVLMDCNHAGIWDCDFDVANIRLNENLTKSKAEKEFSDKIYVFDGGKKWFIPSFIEFQYGELSENNRAHTGVISLLKKHNLLNEDLSIKPLQSPLQGDKDKEKEKDKEQDKEKDKGCASEKKELVYPFDGPEFAMAWSNWLKYRHEKKISYKGIISQQAALKALSKYDEEFSIMLIEKSMGNGWQGLVFDKTDEEYARFKQTGTKAQFGKEVDELIGSGSRGY